ncbi:hypothetical protein MKW94_001389 [Papaver nudicaule]|uniref:Angiotensin-converting enzyme 2 n=1 Tax=Papaver nudicaule TaxID=74823 RepID=A0AA41RPX4_PAPNU|nr:hypothetical protein [Papaver nudicaule]
MKHLEEPLSMPEIQPSGQDSHESQGDEQNTPANDTPLADSGSISISSNDTRKVSQKDIVLVQNLIEHCLQLYMNKDEVVKTLLNQAKIEPAFTALVWQKLEEENAEFFKAYYTRLKLKKQIIMFNHLLEHQYHLMKYPAPPKVPMVPMQNGVHHMPGNFSFQTSVTAVNKLPMGYPVLQQPPMPAAAHQSHLDSMGHGLSSCHVVNGVPAHSNFHPMRMNSGSDMGMESTSAYAAPTIPPTSAMSSMSEMAMSPASVASNGQFPFTSSDISGMGLEASVLDNTFPSDVGSSVGLQLGLDSGDGNGNDSLRSFGQIPWNFSLSDLDLSNLADLGALGNYPGSPFLPSDSDIMLDSPSNDDLVQEFFVDNPVQGQSDEDQKP